MWNWATTWRSGVVAAALALSGQAAAQTGTPGLVESDGHNVHGQNLSYVTPAGTPTERGTLFAERLRGNGTRAGYLLSHGGIIPNTFSVTVGGRILRENRDYVLDPQSGVLSFAEPVRPGDTIRVTYRYVASADSDRSPLGFTNLRLNMKGTSLSFGLGISKDAARGLDFTTYGLSLQPAGASGLSGMLYVSTPAGNSRNLVDDLSTTREPKTRKVDPASLVSDTLIAQNLSLGSGGTSLRATYQNVGRNFNGFQALKQAGGKDATALAQLDALEKEKGLIRQGFGLGLALSQKDSLKFDWDRVGDSAGGVTRQALGLKAGAVDLTYNLRSVGEKFDRFKDLRDADKAQLAREKALERSDLTLGITGKQSAFSLSQLSAEDASGAFRRRGIDLTAGNSSFSLVNRSSSADFKRIASLTDPERAALALDIRRQFNPRAEAKEVTAKDLEQIGLDAGIQRNRMSFATGFGAGSRLSLNQFSVSDDSGGIRRRMMEYVAKGLSITYMRQSIDQEFERISKLSDFERSQFGNERGVSREAVNLTAALNKTTSLAFSQLSINAKDGGMSRQSVGLETKGVAVKLNMAETDSGFDRARDLAIPDPEKKAIEAERGFRRMDLSTRITAFRGLTLESFNLRSANAEKEIDRNQFRHALEWAVGKGATLRLLSEGQSLSAEDALRERIKHELIAFNRQFQNGWKLAMYRDVVATVKDGDEKPDVVTSFFRFETAQDKPNSLFAETKRIDKGDDKFENTTHVNLSLKPSDDLQLRLNQLRIDRGDDPSATTNTVEVKYQVSPVLAVTGAKADTSTNNDTSVSSRSFGLDTKAGDIAVKGAFTEVDQHDKNLKTVADVTVATVKPMDVMGMEDVTISAKYASVNDNHAHVTEMAAGKIQGKLGTSSVSAEYNSSLDQKGNAQVARTLTFSNKDAKDPLLFDVLYRARNINRDNVQLVRKYNLALKVAQRTAITYLYTSLPEDASMNIQQVKSSGFGLKQVLTPRISLGMDYVTARDMTKNTSSRKLATSLVGKLDRLAAIEVVYSVDISSQGDSHTDAHTVRLSYDRQVDGDRFISLVATWVDYKAGAQDDLQANIQWKTRF